MYWNIINHNKFMYEKNLRKSSNVFFWKQFDVFWYLHAFQNNYRLVSATSRGTGSIFLYFDNLNDIWIQNYLNYSKLKSGKIQLISRIEFYYL